MIPPPAAMAMNGIIPTGVSIPSGVFSFRRGAFQTSRKDSGSTRRGSRSRRRIAAVRIPAEEHQRSESSLSGAAGSCRVETASPSFTLAVANRSPFAKNCTRCSRARLAVAFLGLAVLVGSQTSSRRTVRPRGVCSPSPGTCSPRRDLPFLPGILFAVCEVPPSPPAFGGAPIRGRRPARCPLFPGGCKCSRREQRYDHHNAKQNTDDFSQPLAFQHKKIPLYAFKTKTEDRSTNSEYPLW
jgi:hypothetical protein